MSPTLTTASNLKVQPGDKLYPVAAAVEKLTARVSGIRRVQRPAVRAWRPKGAARRMLLPSVMLGGRRVTSLEAVATWLQEVTDSRYGQQS